MHITKQLLTGLITVATVGFAHGATISDVGTTGTFDAAGDNDIDLDPTGQLVAFKAAVATAYANDQGGVIDWVEGVTATPSAGSAPGNSMTAINAAYATGGAETLTVTFDRTIVLYTNDIAGQVSGLSDPNAIVADGGNDAIGLGFDMAFSGADVAEIGFAMLARSTFTGGGLNFSATATFSDATTSLIEYTVDDADTDTFLYFAAPGSETISSLFVTWVSDGTEGRANGQRRPVMDDFGFVVVPEPSSLAMLGLGGLLIARRRRG